MSILKRIVSSGILLIIALALTRQASAVNYKFNMSYIYFGNSAGYTGLVDAAQHSLNEVAPNYFNLDSFGHLVITNAANRKFVDDMHQRGIKVVPYLTNDWNRTVGIKALNNKEALVAQLTAAIDAYQLDGINVDLENLTHDQRGDYVELVRLLREQLPADKIIAVAVAANPNGWSTGWQGSYDYAGLAAYCDYIMIMAYDESWYGSKPGPVASYSFVERSVTYALGLVPEEKIVLGLPFYGRIWSEDGNYPTGYGVSNTRVTQLIAAYGGTTVYDSTNRSPKAVITVKASDSKPVVGGKSLTAGTYTIWYENEQSLKAKLTLVQKYNFKGAGSWSLGQETQGTWNYYKLWLNGCSFSDIQTSWAKDYILSAFMHQWINGITPDTFAPEQPLTRAQAAAILVRMLGFPMVEDTAPPFADTKGSWAEDYISTARHYGLIDGIGNNLYAPDRTVTRQEIAVMLNNYLGYSGTGQVAFKDVSEATQPWSYEAINALSTAGIITGYPDGGFKPSADITRAEATALLSRLQLA